MDNLDEVVSTQTQILPAVKTVKADTSIGYPDKQSNGSQDIIVEPVSTNDSQGLLFAVSPDRKKSALLPENLQSNGKQEASTQNRARPDTSNGYKEPKKKSVPQTQLEKEIQAGSSSFSPLQRPAARVKKRRVLPIMIGLILLVALVLASVRFVGVVSDSNDQLLVQVGNQQPGTIDLRDAFPISPYLFGTNVFPAIGTKSLDNTYTGFMNYGPAIYNGLRDAQIKLMRFPGGNWGEQNVLSYDQLNNFSKLLNQTGADGMVQTFLSGQAGDIPSPDPLSLQEEANLAGQWVDYMNNPKSHLRTGKYANSPYHPIKFWTVGNEPDLLINPDTGKLFTVKEYTADFIQFSIAMHQNDPTIEVLGPEISQFYGVNVGPKDSTGELWMEGFLKGVGDYEQAHPELKFHLLDGVSIHHYPVGDATNAPGLLLTSPAEWTYLLPPLRQLIQRDLGRDAPVGVTEINTNPTKAVPTPGLAALWWGDTLGSLMSQRTEFVAFFSTQGVDTPYPLFNEKLAPTAMMRVMQMFAVLQHNYIPVGIQANPVSIYATQDDTHQTLSLMFINKSSTVQSARISVKNSFFGLTTWPDTNVSLFGDSIIVITLHHNGGADAYSYKVPTNEDPRVDTVNFNKCGNDADVLANVKPC